MSMSRLIDNATTKKLVDFKDVNKYTGNYQAAFNKVIGLLTNNSYYICKSTKMYFQATMLMNIKTKYSVLISAIQKNWKDKTTYLTKTVLQIIRHFKFMERNEKSNKVVL